MVEGKKRSGRKINAWISDDLYAQVDDLGYNTWTEAIVNGLETLVQKSTEKSTEQPTKVQEGTDKCIVDDFEVQKVQLEYEGKLRELNAQTIEQKAHIETLQRELAKAHEDKDTIQNHYDNYMRQMQTLIQQKAIESPGAKKPWWRFW
jgi:peptidoglycan hydrolase CwlO-like protein